MAIATLLLAFFHFWAVVALPSNPPFPYNPGFDIRSVATLAKSLPSHSWEYGTASEALLELYDQKYSVFGKAPFPVPTLPPADVQSLSYAESVIVIEPHQQSLSNDNGTVGDPASLGVSAVLLGKTNRTFADAATAQLNYLVNSAPRFSNDAISHRVSELELWADFIYMAPPFIAYYGADTHNESLLQLAIKQCGLYRQVLQENTTATYQGVWSHIVGPSNQDLGLWSTGNGWAAAGMTRVLATVMKAPVSQRAPWRKGAIANLTLWIREILDGARGAPPDRNGLLRNYLNDTATAHGFGEISGSSLLASVAYRMAVLLPAQFGDEYIRFAENIRTVLGGLDPDGNSYITRTGVVTPAVDPLNWLNETRITTGSPEGQNFVVLMYAAWRDCVDKKYCDPPSKPAE